MKTLIKLAVYNVSVSIVNSAGETPKDVARRFGRLACVNLLGGDTGTSQLGHKCNIYVSLLLLHAIT